jgi:prefoldin subunit 5
MMNIENILKQGNQALYDDYKDKLDKAQTAANNKLDAYKFYAQQQENAYDKQVDALNSEADSYQKQIDALDEANMNLKSKMNCLIYKKS